MLTRFTFTGNERLQQMMGIMAGERGGSVFSTDERWADLPLFLEHSLTLLTRLRRFCIDNGIMIAHAGLLAYRMGYETPLEKTSCTQR